MLARPPAAAPCSVRYHHGRISYSLGRAGRKDATQASTVDLDAGVKPTGAIVDSPEEQLPTDNANADTSVALPILTTRCNIYVYCIASNVF